MQSRNGGERAHLQEEAARDLKEADDFHQKAMAAQRKQPAGGSGPTGAEPGFGSQGGALVVGAVVEVDVPFKDLERHAIFPVVPQLAAPIAAHEHWGVVRLQNYRGAPLDLKFIPLPADQVPTVAKRYEAKYNEAFKDKSGQKPSAEKILDVADYALTHDRNDKFVEVMKKLGEDNPTNPAFVAFQKIQADLDRPVTRDDSAAWTSRLGGNYKGETLKDNKGHYLLFHTSDSNPDDVQELLTRLEDSLHTFYYWFARQGVVLPLPDGRLPALLAAKEPEFHHTGGSLGDPPVVADAFFARRENLMVVCGRPLDPLYDMLDKAADPVFKQGSIVRYDMLSGKEYAGYPKGTSQANIAYFGTLALLMKALEDESERAGVTNNASRQLLFASGLLPRTVTAPEWIQFGMGSFFETAEHSPWPTPAAPSPLYLSMYQQEMTKGMKFEGDAYKNLRHRHRRVFPRPLAGRDKGQVPPAAQGANRGLVADVLPRQQEARQPAALFQGAERHAARPGAGRRHALGVLRSVVRRLRPQDEAVRRRQAQQPRRGVAGLPQPGTPGGGRPDADAGKDHERPQAGGRQAADAVRPGNHAYQPERAARGAVQTLAGASGWSSFSGASCLSPNLKANWPGSTASGRRNANGI